MIYGFRSALFYRIWTSLLLLMVAMLIGAIASQAHGTNGDTLFASIVMVVSLITGIMVLVGACRALVAFIRAVVWR